MNLMVIIEELANVRLVVLIRLQQVKHVVTADIELQVGRKENLERDMQQRRVR